MAGRRMFAEDEEQESHWISVSDLMAGLMMVFLLVLIIYHREVDPPPIEPPGPEPTVDGTQVVPPPDPEPPSASGTDDADGALPVFAQQALATECDLANDLESEFSDEGKVPGFKIVRGEADSNCQLTVSLERPDTLFKVGNADLAPQFKKTLAVFFPRYIALIYSNEEFRNYVSEVRIEGHTSSEWRDEENPSKWLPPREAFIKNMELSQNRTRSVLDHVLSPEMLDAVVAEVRGRIRFLALTRGPDLRQEVEEWMVKTVSANGLSSSRLIYTDDGAEDAVRSRRVEFALRTRGKEAVLDYVGELHRAGRLDLE